MSPKGDTKAFPRSTSLKIRRARGVMKKRIFILKGMLKQRSLILKWQLVENKTIMRNVYRGVNETVYLM
jgi:hypothetical protein